MYKHVYDNLHLMQNIIESSKELIKKYDVIGTNKDGPYRTGETNRLRSTK